MFSFDLKANQVFDPRRHCERVLGTSGEGDIAIACREPGQTSPDWRQRPEDLEYFRQYPAEGGGPQ